MPRRRRFLTARELVRAALACSEGEFDGVNRLTEACYSAQELALPDPFLISGLAALEQAIEGYGFGRETFPGGFEHERRRREQLATANEAGLASALRERSDDRTPLLICDHGVDSALYRDLAIAPPGRPRIGYLSEQPWPASRLGPRMVAGTEECPREPVELPNALEPWVVHGWRQDLAAYLEPGPALQIALLAARSGQLPGGPEEVVWHHLALAIGRHRERVPLPDVLEIGDLLGIRPPLCQGLALARHLFPELREWSQPERWGYGSWQLQVPVRIFARRMVAATFA